jgi:hypothetical protein
MWPARPRRWVLAKMQAGSVVQQMSRAGPQCCECAKIQAGGVVATDVACRAQALRMGENRLGVLCNRCRVRGPGAANVRTYELGVLCNRCRVQRSGAANGRNYRLGELCNRCRVQGPRAQHSQPNVRSLAAPGPCTRHMMHNAASLYSCPFATLVPCTRHLLHNAASLHFR